MQIDSVHLQNIKKFKIAVIISIRYDHASKLILWLIVKCVKILLMNFVFLKNSDSMNDNVLREAVKEEFCIKLKLWTFFCWTYLILFTLYKDLCVSSAICWQSFCQLVVKQLILNVLCQKDYRFVELFFTKIEHKNTRDFKHLM